jgi:hypothetical protein
MLALDLLVGSGGVLSHAPRRVQAALMLVDSFEPQGVTRLAVDSIFMMPQLGVLSTVHRRRPCRCFHRDCLVPLGTVSGAGGARARRARRCGPCASSSPAGPTALEVRAGELQRVPLPRARRCARASSPARGVDVGAGPGVPLDCELEGGEAGLLLDGRGRPIVLPAEPAARVAALERWSAALDLYPRE